MSVTFEFGVPFQRSILRLCQIDEGFNHRAMKLLDPGYFTTEPLGWIFKSMRDYYSEYGVRCTENPLREMVRKVDAEKAPRYGLEVENVIGVGWVVEDAFIKEKLKDFLQRSMFSRAHRDAAVLYNEGKLVDAYDVTQRTMDEIRKITFDSVDRSLFFEQFDDRQKARAMQALDPSGDTITTGIPELDEVLEGGIHVGELYLIIAYAKIGKSTFLVDQGFTAVRVERVPVLHVGLEGRREQTENKYDTLFSGELYTAVKRGDISVRSYQEMIAEYKLLRGLLIIRHLTDWNVNILDIDAELKENRTQGHVPRLIIVDYLDLLRSRTRASSESEHQLAAARDLKQLANRGYAVWSASQAQRPRKNADDKEHVVKSYDIADSFAKIRIADGYGSLNATNKEQKEDQMRLYWENWRDGPAKLYLRMQNDRSRMKLGVKREVMKPPKEESEEDDE